MVERCGDCRKYEEHIYWNHHDVRFFQPMYTDSFRSLSIPRKFVQQFREELSDTITLKGPSGYMWDVGLIRTDDEMSLQNGWREFAEEHSLVVNDLLVFTYVGDSQFDVLIFGRGGCEKVGSYFIRKCGTNQYKSKCQQKEEASKDFTGPSHARMENARDSQKTPDQSTHFKHPQSNGKAVKETQYVLRRGNRKIGSRGLSVDTESRNSELKSSKTGRCDVKQRLDLTPLDGCLSYPLHFISNRRPVTEEERDRAWQLASAFKTVKPSFRAVMRSTHVCRRFYMTIPAEFVRDHLNYKSQLVTISIPSGETWPVFYRHRNTGLSGLGKGWADFVFDNNLEEGDACVFELSRKRELIVLNVHIFRVVEEVVPPIQFTNLSMKKKLLNTSKRGTRKGRWTRKPM
ncbi:B3 domain-containing protein REM16-like isoform X2 [Magnolia sinica]|uniref:B3 domain-containing protein REM16-like isoform X2 n=1 Tax=Magnolia sinica TaxID=86752 RepID=UPI0026590AE3|nr:B3 domain-containing protein REM16-like isoform X2 [Magnolia sinica]XP_058081447.1 B3 domain-containing protein REM16-like isoform X2 [Magnolia sinica]XP_058081448.1 B3 domain-containing protein REM16-like isoform X2 [Magnolia sinica]